MIRHRPTGSGHPYSIDTEQRFPVVPIAGESAMLGIGADAGVVAARCELEWAPDDAGAAHRVELDLQPVATTSRGRVTDGGHLASAAARRGGAAGGWQASTPELRFGGTYRYRFTGSREDGREER